MTIPANVLEALQRLFLYNSGPISAANPHGFGNYGNITEIPRCLTDMGTVAQWISETGGLPGPQGEQGSPGLPGADGRELELQKGATHLQWRLTGGAAWIDLIAIADLKGERGETGPKGDAFTVDATGLFADRSLYDAEPEGFSFLATDLGQLFFRDGLASGGWSAGLEFGRGDDGVPGRDGREIELSVSATHIQWRYAGEATWENLKALADLRGADGDDGSPGRPGDNGAPGSDGREVEFQKSATHIQWRYAGGSSWINLVALADLKGADGSDATVPDATTTVKGKVQLATVAEVRAAATGDKALVAEQLKDAVALVALTDAATIAVNWTGFYSATVSLAGNRTLGNPTNVIAGQTKAIIVKAASGTRTLAFGSNYKGDLPTLNDVSATKWYLLTLFAESANHIVVSSVRAF